MRIDLVLVVLTFYQAKEIYSSLLGGRDNFFAYSFSSADVSLYPAERIAPLRRQKTIDGLDLLERGSTFDVQWLLETTCKKTFEDQGDLKQYLGAVADDAGFSREVIS